MDALLSEHLVLHEHLTFTETRDGKDLVLIQLEGFLECQRGLVVHVAKQMEVRDERGHDQVKTFGYSYHARIPAMNRELLRYDNAHGPLHRHHFDVGTGNETHTEFITEDDMPTLDGVIREAYELCLLVVLKSPDE